MEGVLFLDPASARHDGPQTLAEYLEEGEEFLPFQTGADFQFVPKSSIELARVREEDESVLPWDDIPLVPSDEDDAPQEVRLKIVMRGGAVIEGEILSAMPPGQRRLIDYLNQPSRFLALRHGETVTMVNKVFVASARPVRD